ncbi:MAG: hypothetical protein HYX52_04605 [Chloroflexi bacterium]|nr:hypothetical protein [Chloroflexota bacterium]
MPTFRSQETAPSECGALMRAIHQRLHETMVFGYQPRLVRLGWEQYGLLWRHQTGTAPLADAARPRTVFGVPVSLGNSPRGLDVVV